MSRLRRVDELTEPPIVGRKYLVPCVQNTDGTWWPIRGPLHDDAEIIGVHQKHWHHDVRFIHRRALPCVPGGKESDRAARKLIGIITPLECGDPAAKVQHKPMRCVRADVEFPLAVQPCYGETLRNPWMGRLEDKFERVKLKCLTCPHRGFSLAGIPPDANGRVVCPGHGLRWNVRSNRLNRRTKRAVNEKAPVAD